MVAPGPNPRRGVSRWSLVRARAHLKGVLVTFFGIPLVIGSMGGLIGLPKHPTLGDRVEQAVVSAVAAFVILGALALLYALIRAPYEQRNALRSRLATVAQSDGAATGALDVLSVMKDQDSERLWEKVAMVRRSVDLSHLADPDPYLDVSLMVLNGSVFDVEFKRVGGQLAFREMSLGSSPEFVATSWGYTIWRGNSGLLIIRQWLTPDAAERVALNRTPGTTTGLEYHSLEILFEIRDAGSRWDRREHFLRLYGVMPFVDE